MIGHGRLVSMAVSVTMKSVLSNAALSSTKSGSQSRSGIGDQKPIAIPDGDPDTDPAR
jgi:hypothetical protein